MAKTPTRKPRAADRASLTPSTPSLEWTAFSHKWWLYNTCMAGTVAARNAGQELLPKHQGEPQERYNERLKRAVFTNFTRLTVEFLVGKPFQTPVSFRKNTPPSLAILASDIDGQGNDLTTVSSNFFAKGFGKGFAYMMVEFPQTDGTPQTLADVQRKNLRPYWCVIEPDNVLAARGMIINGRWEWTHVRIFSSEIEYKGFEEVVQDYIKLYQLVNVAADDTSDPIFTVTVETFKRDKPGKEDWTSQGTVPMSISRIPLVRFNSNPDGDMTLEDMLWLNVEHYQSSSDQKAALTMARFPILAGSGVDQEKAYVVGSYEMLITSDSQSKFYYVENSGIAIAVGNTDISNIEQKIAMYGAQMLKKKADRETATRSVIDESQNMAPLQIMVIQFMSAMEQACDFTLMWLQDSAYNDTNTYGIDVNLDFAMSDENARLMAFAENARLQGDMSREQFYVVAADLGYLPDVFNSQTNDTQLAAEFADYIKQLEAVASATPDPTITGEGSPINDQTPTPVKRSASVSYKVKT